MYFILKSEIFILKKNAFLQDDLKATLTARNREAKQLTQLERTRQRNPSDRHVIVSFEFWSLKKYSVRYAVKSKYI